MLSTKEIQTFLVEQGLYTDVVDGLFGPKTSVAARSYLDLRGVSSVGWTDSRVQTAVGQAILFKLGFDPGPIDGLEGSKTKAAFNNWQAVVGHPQTIVNPLVIDISHHNNITSFEKVWASGIRGIIHKATEGQFYVDPTFKMRAAKIMSLGFMLGAYHFGNGSDVDNQVYHFLDTVKFVVGDVNSKYTLLALDWEKDPNGNTMSLDQARRFVKLIESETGQKPVIYSGNLIKEQAGPKGDSVLNECRLWLAQYGNKPVLPHGFDEYFLWQYSGDGIGPLPHTVPGIDGNVDMNSYQGTPKDLVAKWTEKMVGV